VIIGHVHAEAAWVETAFRTIIGFFKPRAQLPSR
jgi:hypothetical protein